MSRSPITLLTLWSLAAFLATGALAQPTPAPSAAAASPVAPAAAAGSPDEVLAESAAAKLTRADYDADVLRVPPEMREEFASNPKRLSAYLNNLMLVKSLAVQARKNGLDPDPIIERRVALEKDRLLAEAEIKRVERAAGAEFDARSADFVVKAKEMYAIDKTKYQVSEQISASHILFDIKKRKPEEALVLAQDARKKLLAGADFATLAREVSEDPSVRNNSGSVGWFGADRMDPAFSKAAFALNKVGDISEPVLSKFGYHLIRLDGRRPAQLRSFDDVQPEIMAELRKRYINDKRDANNEAIRSDPTLKVNQAAVDSLLFHVDASQFGFGKQRAK